MKIKYLLLTLFINFSPTLLPAIYEGTISISNQCDLPILQQPFWCCRYPFMRKFSNIDKNDKEIIDVVIKLKNKNKLLTYLPVSTFKNDDETFKEPGEIIELIFNQQSNVVSVNEFWTDMHNAENSHYYQDTWQLTLDSSFNKIDYYYEEFKFNGTCSIQ